MGAAPGAFNHPDLPKFDGPGPGRHALDFGDQATLPARACAARTVQAPGSAAAVGGDGGWDVGHVHADGRDLARARIRPQAQPRPPPRASPRSRLSAATPAASHPVAQQPTGPGLYTPSEKMLSNRRNQTAGGASLPTIATSTSATSIPIPARCGRTFAWAAVQAFGPVYLNALANGHVWRAGAGTIKKPPSRTGVAGSRAMITPLRSPTAPRRRPSRVRQHPTSARLRRLVRSSTPPRASTARCLWI